MWILLLSLVLYDKPTSLTGEFDDEAACHRAASAHYASITRTIPKPRAIMGYSCTPKRTSK
jgi:hypothetical protein